MGIYARRPWRFLGQLSADLFVVLWAVTWWLVGSFVHTSIGAVADPARQTATTTEQLAGNLREAGTQTAGVPGLGEQLRRPFDAAAESLSGLTTAANAQIVSIERLATIIGWLVFLIPVTVLVALWLPQRIRFFVRARAAQQFIDSDADLSLFALRAMTSQPMHVIARISDDPVKAWRAGDSAVINRLAEVELRRIGLRMPDTLRTEARAQPVTPGQG